MFDLTGKVALVTGAGQGMGLGIARALARQGAAVAVNDIVSERATAAAAKMDGARVIAAPGDVTAPDDRASMFETVRAAFGAVDILVNNAGVITGGMPIRKFETLDEGDFRAQIELNYLAVTGMTRLALPHMRAARWGRIINITSESWRLGLDFGLTHYASAKAAMVGFTRMASREFGPGGVTINAISLGTMNNFDDFSGIAERSTAVGRAGTPDDVGALAVYLASVEASWITGQVIALNGGSNVS